MGNEQQGIKGEGWKGGQERGLEWVKINYQKYLQPWSFGDRI